MKHEHHYQLLVTWTGNTGTGTRSYATYKRDHIISIEGKSEIAGSSDVSFLGDKSRYNPEELLIASLASCHMLWFLHLCSEHGVVVEHYSDKASGTMIMDKDGGGRFSHVELNPEVVLAQSTTTSLDELHHKANELCFIARSCNFPVIHHQRCRVKNS